jgi:hypothetical protein
MARSLAVAMASRAETMTQPAWRLVLRKVRADGSTYILDDLRGRGSATNAAVRFWRGAALYRDSRDTNIELLERSAGASRFRPIVQAAGNHVIWWVSKQDASAYGQHVGSGWSESYQGEG